MSPNVGNFVHDLVEMAKAMETLPQVQAELERAYADNSSLIAQTNSLKADLEQSRNYAASLEQKVKTTEAERDDAELRFLELDEKAHKAITMVGNITGLAMAVNDVLTPPKPQPEPEPVQPPVHEAVHSIEPQPQGQSEGHPTDTPKDGSGSTESAAPVGDGGQPGPATQPPANQDKSDANPTVLSDIGKSQTVISGETQTPVASGAQTTDDALQTKPDPSGPYTGKSYRQHPVYVSPHNWIAGGGTEEAYYS